MRISYNKLWKLLIDKGMTKMELKDAAGVSATSIVSSVREATSQQMFCSKSARR